jgi:threonine dehydratase
MKNLLTNPQPSQSDYVNAIVKLGSRVYEAATVTPLQKMGKLSAYIIIFGLSVKTASQ